MLSDRVIDSEYMSTGFEILSYGTRLFVMYKHLKYKIMNYQQEWSLLILEYKCIFI